MAGRIDDGFPTRVSFSAFSNVNIWDKSVKPPGLDSGGPNDTTNMRNTTVRTMAPKKLFTVTPGSSKFLYAVALLNDVIAAKGINQQITWTYPDGSSIQIWGWIDKVEFDDIKEGESATGTITYQPSNQDNTGAEVAPVITLT